MPISIRHRDGRDEPVIVCDECGEVIEDARQGNDQWVMQPDGGQMMAEGDIAPMAFTHKACCHPFEAKRGRRGGGVLWGAIGLDCLPIYLMTNLKIDQKRARESARLMASI